MATIKVNSTVMRDKASGFKTVSSSIKTFTNEMTQEISLRDFLMISKKSATPLINMLTSLIRLLIVMIRLSLP